MKKIADRYARALFQLIQTPPGQEEQFKDFEKLQAYIQGSLEFRKFLINPACSVKMREKIIKELAEQAKFSPLTRNFLILLVHKRRLNILITIIECYKRLYYAAHNIEVAFLETIETLPEGVLKSIQVSLEKHFKKKLILQQKINKKLLGGFRVKIGSHLMDASLQTQLLKIGRLLKGT